MEKKKPEKLTLFKLPLKQQKQTKTNRENQVLEPMIKRKDKTKQNKTKNLSLKQI